MNIEEIARKENIVPYIIGPQNYEYLGRLQAFANAVIKAHTEELIAGVGEPAGYAVPTFNFDNSVIQAVQYAGTEPLYTAAQVAGVVLKAKQERDKELIAGVGGISAWLSKHGHVQVNHEGLSKHHADEYSKSPDWRSLYTPEQVAGAIAAERRKHKVAIGIANVTIEAEGRRIAELGTLNLGLQNNNRHLKYRIAELKSALEVAQARLEKADKISGCGNNKSLIKQIEGVLKC